MEIFNPKLLVPGNCTIHGELFENSSFELPLTLFWKISIPLEDFKIGNFTICKPEIELGSFTLPHISVSPKFDKTKKILRSWKELINSTFDFSESFSDNIGSIYYNIKSQELGDNLKDNVIDTEATDSFDNIIDVHKIEFREINQNRINTKLTIQIHFDSFNMQEPPFGKEFQCNIFDIELNLEIKEVTLINNLTLVNNETEALTISQKALQINDYNIMSENKKVFVSLTEYYNRIDYFFKPNFSFADELGTTDSP